LHGVVFDIFIGSHSDAARLRESCLKPHTPARPSVAKWRTISAQNCDPKLVFPFAVQRIGDFVIELTTRSVF
jgi:hypothetical protein